jgi:hypothetical protein
MVLGLALPFILLVLTSAGQGSPRAWPSNKDQIESEVSSPKILYPFCLYSTFPPSKFANTLGSRSRGSKQAKAQMRQPHYHPRFRHPSSLQLLLELLSPPGAVNQIRLRAEAGMKWVAGLGSVLFKARVAFEPPPRLVPSALFAILAIH